VVEHLGGVQEALLQALAPQKKKKGKKFIN
jgi:hypothetical protein